MRGQTYVILSIIFVIIVAIFAITNVDPVEVNYLFWQQDSPLILVILFSVLMGGIITASVGAVKVYQMKKQVKELQTEKQELQRVIEQHDPEEQVQAEQELIETAPPEKTE